MKTNGKPSWWSVELERAFMAWFWRDRRRVYDAECGKGEYKKLENVGASIESIDAARRAYVAGLQQADRLGFK